MYIQSIEISSYKSYRNSGKIEFDPGVNLIVGANNSGKTALLEALSLRFGSKPYVDDSIAEPPDSSIRTTFCVEASDIDRATVANTIAMPAFQDGIPISYAMLINALDDGFPVWVGSTPERPIAQLSYPHLGRELTRTANTAIAFHFDVRGQVSSSGREQGGGTPFIDEYVQRYVSRIFHFSGERMAVHTCGIYEDPGQLEGNARNLAACLLEKLTENEDRYRNEYLSLVNRVLPVIKYASPRVIQNNQVTIRVWPKEQAGSNVNHLLSESGTGVGQVLAILYVIAYSDPSVIVIDEPNSFLHPAATRELLQIFKENTQHQYFISTHSPEVFAELKPEFYTSLEYDGETTASRESFGNLVATYRELGISPFFERALWVEGETEVEAFKKILADPHMQIFKVLSPSELGARLNKKSELDRLIEIHTNMINARNGEPVPSDVKFLIDGENLARGDVDGYGRRPDKIVHFLKRKMFENYLLNAEAISKVISETWGKEVTEANVQFILDNERGAADEADWLRDAHGANILARIFAELTSAECEFRKTDHSVRLTSYLLESSSHSFDEIRASVEHAFHLDEDAPAAA